MPEETPNRGYYRPAEGTENWDVPLNNNFTNIDKDVQQALDLAASAIGASSRRVVTPDEDLQSALNNNEAVYLVAGETYSPGTTVNIPERTVIVAPDSIIEVTGNYDGIIVMNRAKIFGCLSVNTDSVDGYSSRAVALDTRSAGSYGYSQPRSETILNVDVRGNLSSESVGVDFYADGKGIYNVKGSIRFEQFDSGIRLAAPNGGHINGNFLYIMGEDSRKLIHHTGDGPARSVLRGSVHVGPSTARVFLNESRNMSFSYFGQVWDVHTGDRNGQSFVKGPRMKVEIPDGDMANLLWNLGVNEEANQGPDSFGTTISATGKNGRYIFNVGQENMIRLGPTWHNGSGHVFSVDHAGLAGDSSTIFTIDEAGNMNLSGKISQNVDLI